MDDTDFEEITKKEFHRLWETGKFKARVDDHRVQTFKLKRGLNQMIMYNKETKRYFQTRVDWHGPIEG